MISGNVTGDREIVIAVEALTANRSVVSIRAIVDTGFNGYLTLPSDQQFPEARKTPGNRGDFTGTFVKPQGEHLFVL
jgi:hypothetical protein